ncbi:ECF RNA polymerase sigma factor SigE [compost metagenome]
MNESLKIEDFEMFFQAHYQDLCLVSYRITRNETSAEDIVQDFFFDLWKKKDQLFIKGEFINYAKISVKNRSLDFIKNKNQQLILVPDHPQEISSESFYNEEIDEQFLKIHEIANLMPKQRKEVFLLNSEGKLKQSEIAAKMGVSINTVKTHVKLAYQFIRQHYKSPASPIWLLFLSLIHQK